MKKFISLLLTFAMLFSLAMPAMAAEGDTATVYFQNNWQWTDVRAYIHYTDGTENAAYPGVAMTFHENDGTYDVYSVTFPVSNIDYIIFSGIKDDGSGARDATPQIPSSELYRNATYYCMWNDGNTYGREGGEGESLDSAAAPSGPSITGGTTGDVSASYTPTPEAKWGTSKDNLTESGTLDEAIAAATAVDSTIGYIQLQTNVTVDSGYDIYSGVFTLDLNGNTLTSDQYVIALRGAAVQVTLTDTASGGEMISMQPSSATVVVSDGQLVIDGGTYSGTYAVNVESGSAEINGGTFTASYVFNVSNGAILTIHEGTIIGDRTSVVTSGTTTINGGTISAGSTGHIEYWGGTLDLSGYAAVNGLTLSQLTDADLTVPNDNIILPEGYVFKDGETIVTTLAPQTVYTIAAEGGAEPTAKITGVSITVDGTEYTEGNVAIYSDSTVTLNVTGTNLQYATADNYVGCYVYRWTVGTNNGFEITDDGTAATKAFIGSDFRGCNAAQINYRNADSSSVFSGITVKYNSGTKPTYYNITVSETENGTVTASKSAAAEGDSITLTVTPAEGYLLGKLTVTNAATSEVTDITDSKTFEMPGSDVTVKAVFEKIPHAITIDENIANGTVTADLEFAVEGSIVTLTVTPNTGYQIGAVTVKDADDNTVGFTETGVASGVYTFTMPASAVTVTASFEAISITSAEITWGSMSFTYSDEQVEQTDGSTADKGWDDSETGWVTVKNTGNTTFTAQPVYTAEADYDEIEGKFYNSADPETPTTMGFVLDSDETVTFILKLVNKPEKAIPAGTKIGTVTITFQEGAPE